MPSVMIVEDEVLIAEDIKSCLESAGFEAAALFTSGEQALTYVDELKPDVAVLDIKLQGELDCIETAKRIYTRYQIPCVFLTSYADPSFLQQAKETGSFGYLLKPFEEFELIAAIEMALYRAKMEAEQRQLQSQLQQAMKMEAIGTLAGGIAHDFNNILTAIMGYGELVKDDLMLAGLQTEKITKVMDAALRAKHLVRQILTFCRHNNKNSVPLDIKAIAKEAVQFLRASIPSTITIHLEIVEEVGHVLADPTQLLQVMMNLCTNAAQAMESSGGKVTITLKNASPDALADVYFNDTPKQRMIHLAVSDNGPGVPEGIIERIFDPFFTTKGVENGSGLGLSVVYGIVHGWGGVVTVKSKTGMGSTFNVFLPQTLVKPAAEVKSADEPLRGSERILLVDDEKMISDMGAQILTRQGYKVTTENVASEALRLFKARPDDFDLLITDQTMPGMTGLQLSSKILELQPDFPIILCTGLSSSIDKDKATELGIRDFVMKPYLKKEMIESIRKVLNNG